MKIEMDKLGQPRHSKLPQSENFMSTEGQADCASIIVMWQLASGFYGQVRGEHATGGNTYDPEIWVGVPNTAETLVVVVPGKSTTTEYGRQLDLANVRRQARQNGLAHATLSLAPSCASWTIDRRAVLFVAGRAPFVAAPIGRGPSSAGPSSPRSKGSGKRAGGH